MAVSARTFLGLCRPISRKFACCAYSGRPVLEMFTKVCEGGGPGAV